MAARKLFVFIRMFRSDAALEAIRQASEKATPNLVLYNYPSYSGAYSALFAHLYHSRLGIPCLVLPFSASIPFSVEDLCIQGVKTCYLLDFFGPQGFAVELSKRTSCRCSEPNIAFHLDVEKSSSLAAYEYFSAKFSEISGHKDDCINLLNHEHQERLEPVLNYIEDGDLRRWSLPDIRPFFTGLRQWLPKLNCTTNSCMYQQLMGICVEDLIGLGNAYISQRQIDSDKLLQNVFKLRLGRGFYGECLGVRADGNSNFSDEMGNELSRMSALAGLRPIGAVIYMKRNNLKMCLRTTDECTDTSRIAKAYGGGGSRSSSSFMIRMDEYNIWRLGSRNDPYQWPSTVPEKYTAIPPSLGVK